MNDLKLTLAQRGRRYGRFKDNAELMQALKQVLRLHHRWSNLSFDQREALEMICHKMGRILNGDPNYADSWMDIAGYATLIVNRLNADRLEADKRPVPESEAHTGTCDQCGKYSDHLVDGACDPY